MHKKINLNFDWFFTEEFNDNHLKNYKNLEGFKQVNLPHTVYLSPYSNFNEKNFFKNVCYKKEIKIKKEYFGKDINLLFEGVGHKTTIYVNDDFVTIHNGGFDEFKVDITDYVKIGETNIITVVCNSCENENIPPFGSFLSFLAYGGIYKKVYLEIVDKERINDFFIRTPNATESITAYCDIELTYTPVEIVLTIFDKESTICVNKYNVNREKETLDFDIKNRKLWSLDNPNLYSINIKMFQDKKLLDEVNGTFGYRDFKVNKDGFYLNDVKTNLVGLNRHGSYPYFGLAAVKSLEYKDAYILKNDLGVNIVRSSYAPFSKEFLNACDEVGLMVINEIPGWNYLGNEEYHKNTLENVKSMILRDRNHPSIVMWGVRISGAACDFKFFNETNALAKELDPTRLTFGAKSTKNEEVIEDVYGYNYYSNVDKKIKVKTNKPNFIISEHTGHMLPTKIFDNEDARVKQALRHLSVLDYTLSDEKILGSIGFSMTDFNTHASFGSSDKICYSGVLDMFRNPKYAQGAYQSQNDNKIVMYFASNKAKGDYKNSKADEFYIFTNCEYVKMFKNDNFVETFYPNYKKYPHLAHPPIIINDEIGQVLQRMEKFSVRDSEIMKKIMKKSLKNNYKISFIDRFKSALILKKYKHGPQYILELFRKYIIGEVNEDVIYRFDGYTNENVCKSITISDIKEINLHMEVDNEKLTVSQTYDMTRVTVKAIDQNNNIIPYVNLGIKIEVTGGIELIGPSIISFLGGYANFYVKTNQKENKGLIKVISDINTLEKEIEIVMKNES